MRKLMWFTIGFSAACIVSAYLLTGIWLALLGGVCFAGLVGALCIKSDRSRIVACALFGCVIGFLWLIAFDKLYLQPVRQMDEQTVVLRVEVTDYSKPTAAGIAVEGKTGRKTLSASALFEYL